MSSTESPSVSAALAQKGYNGSPTQVKFAEPSWSVEWIDSQESLDSICIELMRETLLSIDTETAGWQTGNERLCLIQIGIPSKQHVIIIDALAVKNLQALEPLLSSKSPALIAHNAPFEERQFSRLGMKMRGVIDTLTMARKLRPDLPNHTLQSCCHYLINRPISKEQQTSDWSKRPLLPEQLRYAALDAEITVAIFRVLSEMEKQLVFDPRFGVPDLMKEMARTVRERLELTKDIAAQLALLNARYDMMRDALRMKLIEGAAPYDGEYGSCKVSRIKQTEIDPIVLRERYPLLAPEVISEQVDRKKLNVLASEHNVSAEEIESITRITGFIDRLSLSVKPAEG